MTAAPLASTATSDLEYISRHRSVWKARPELRAVYRQFFKRILDAAGTRAPVVELGAGPGFFKEHRADLIATDVIHTGFADLVCDACSMPFRSGSVGAFVMLDVLHHMARPLDFIAEAARALAPGGVLAAIEPWITPASYVLYRWFHHEDCRLGIDVANPFGLPGKTAFEGNAAIPFRLARHCAGAAESPLRLVRLEPFLGLPYLASLGYKRTRPLPPFWTEAAGRLERSLGPIGRWNATRALMVWEKTG